MAILLANAGCSRADERRSDPAASASAAPLDEALKLGPIALAGDEAQNFWEGMVSTKAQNRWVEATLDRRFEAGYAARFQGPFAPGRSIRNTASAWVSASDELAPFLGSRIMCKVREVDARRGGVVLACDAAHERARRETLSRLVPGSTWNARVTTVAEYAAWIELDDVPHDLWLASVMIHATAFGAAGAPKEGARITVTPDKPWTPSFDGSTFWVRRP